MTTVLAPTSGTVANAPAAPSVRQENQISGERFMKLLITQLQNQDPLNPMDNAQLTTQMAQINTVAGIEKLNDSITAMSGKLSALDSNASLATLNESIKGLSGQLLQSQTLQGAGLVGREVLMAGSGLNVQDGAGQGAFDLAGPADAVAVDVLGPGGHVLARVDLGAQARGRVRFDWPVPEGVDPAGLSFRVDARSGATAVRATPYAVDRVQSVSTGADGLKLQLARAGVTPLDRVQHFS